MIEQKTIDDMLLSLDAIIAKSQADSSRIGYFACVYRKIVRIMHEQIEAEVFDDAPRVQRLLMVLVRRYLDAYTAYAHKHETSDSWRLCFEASKRDDITLIQHILLGLNALVNVDLGIAVSQVSVHKSVNTIEDDFLRFIQILVAVINSVQTELEEIWIPMRTLDKMSLKNVGILHFNMHLSKEHAWNVARELSHLRFNQHKTFIEHLDKTVESWGQKILKPSLTQKPYLKLIKWSELPEPTQVIEVLK